MIPDSMTTEFECLKKLKKMLSMTPKTYSNLKGRLVEMSILLDNSEGELDLEIETELKLSSRKI